MSDTILVRGARQVLTLRGPDAPRGGEEMSDLGVIDDGAVLIRGGVVVEANTTRRIENLAEARNAREIDAHGRIVLPGLIDAHTHLLYPPPESPTPSPRSLAPARLARSAGAILESMLRHGSTTIEVKTGAAAGDIPMHLRLLRVAETFAGREPQVVATALAGGGSAEDYARFSRDALRRIRTRGLARFAGLWVDTAGEESARRVCAAVREQRLSLKLLDGAPEGAAARLAVEYGALSVDGLRACGTEFAHLLAGAGVVSTLAPFDAVLDGSAPPPARALIDAGAAVALASGWRAGRGAFNLQAAAALATLHCGMRVEESIAAVTINAACALGLGQRVGSLAVGKAADLVILDLEDYRDLPRSLGGNLVHLVMMNGKVVVRM